MTRREKSMLTMVVVLVVVMAHLIVGKKYLAAHQQKQSDLTALQAKANSYRNAGAIAEEIAGEVEWLERYQPAPSSYGRTQSALVKFLNDSGRQLGFTPVRPRLIQIQDEGGRYRRVKVEITATASEEKIYQWLVNIHKPTQFRAVTHIVLKPTTKDDEKVTCTLTAEQWLVDAEQFSNQGGTEG